MPTSCSVVPHAATGVDSGAAGEAGAGDRSEQRAQRAGRCAKTAGPAEHVHRLPAPAAAGAASCCSDLPCLRVCAGVQTNDGRLLSGSPEVSKPKAGVYRCGAGVARLQQACHPHPAGNPSRWSWPGRPWSASRPWARCAADIPPVPSSERTTAAPPCPLVFTHVRAMKVPVNKRQAGTVHVRLLGLAVMQDLPQVQKGFLWVGLIMDLISKGGSCQLCSSRLLKHCLPGRACLCSHTCNMHKPAVCLQALCCSKSSAWRGTACG